MEGKGHIRARNAKAITGKGANTARVWRPDAGQVSAPRRILRTDRTVLRTVRESAPAIVTASSCQSNASNHTGSTDRVRNITASSDGAVSFEWDFASAVAKSRGRDPAGVSDNPVFVEPTK